MAGGISVPAQYQGWVNSASQGTGLPASVVAAQINMESGFNPKAVSPTGAQGIAQFEPGTWASNAPKGSSPFDPNASLAAYTKLMGNLVKQYGGNVKNALAAYNAGPGNLGAGMGYANSILSAAGHGTGLSITPSTASVKLPGVTNPASTTTLTTTPATVDWGAAGVAALEKADSSINTSGTFKSSGLGLLGSMVSAANSGNYMTPGTSVATTVKLPNPSGTAAAPSSVQEGNLHGLTVGAGVNISVNNTPKIAAALAALGRQLGDTMYAISGYRTPAHSVAVGGFADDPHTKGNAIDFGVDGPTRESAAQITNAQLASVGLWRPFDQNGQNPNEVNHVELIGMS